MTALVTGGGSGLGLATVHRFVRQGARVALCDLPTIKDVDLEDDVEKNVLMALGNVRSENDMRGVMSTIAEKFGKLDVLVNCAGIGVAYGLYNFKTDLAHTLEHFESVHRTNTIGLMNVTRLAVELMSQNEGDEDGHRGTVVNTTGISAFDGQHGQSAYASTCGAAAGMTLPLARDLASKGIRCCAIAAGHFDTRLLESIPEEVLTFLEETVPHPSRLGNPDEFAHLVQFLVENPLMNGETIRIDGALRLVC